MTTDEVPQFEERCSVCRGDGVVPHHRPGRPPQMCGNCRGVGYTPTELGMALLEFLRRRNLAEDWT